MISADPPGDEMTNICQDVLLKISCNSEQQQPTRERVKAADAGEPSSHLRCWICSDREQLLSLGAADQRTQQSPPLPSHRDPNRELLPPSSSPGSRAAATVASQRASSSRRRTQEQRRAEFQIASRGRPTARRVAAVPGFVQARTALLPSRTTANHHLYRSVNIIAVAGKAPAGTVSPENL
ncbi:hypothetical protein HAX54_048560 [Datura stramonium]|uniref:Uncharacterized protein n=1 Tax=Datura stramonium TaxID=4076 RepID=A0ABS8SUH5_DATST|nr:hypothetical protein [Datura stramonium]